MPAFRDSFEVRMRRTALFTVLTLVATGTLAANPARLPGPAFPSYATPAALEAACSANLATAGQAVKRLEQRRVDAGWLNASDDLNALLEDLASPVFFLSNVHPDAPMRTASEACELRWQAFINTLGQNETLYRAARRFQPKDAIDRELRKQSLEGFEDAGVSLLAAR
jgi:thimet oligopeptidase